MTQNFSEIKLTFSDLNNLIEQCSSDIRGCMEVFYLQSKKINELFLNTCNHHEKLEFLHKRLVLANCFQSEVERGIEMITVSEKEVENEVGNLESCVFLTCSCKGMPLDTFRRNTYELAENINTKLSNIEEIFNRIENHTYSSRDNSNFDIFTYILRNFLRQLENIETKIYQLRDKLNHVQYNHPILFYNITNRDLQ